MRPLRVLGLAEREQQGSSPNLVCEDPATGEQFSIPCDDRLRAGARGDLSRFGQLEIEMESQLRPKEIQARIRAGATVEQVASIAGTSASRVERFAYPVLLERASVAERAVKARPAIDGITAGASVAETVAATLSARGHDGDVRWDAFKDDEGWVLALTWHAGRSENRAHWLFHPGPDGGTLSARDEAAAEIVDPALRILRPLRPVGVATALSDAIVRDASVRDETASDSRLDSQRPTDRPVRVGEQSRTSHPAGSKLPNTTPSARPSGPTRDRPAVRGTRFGAPLQPQSLAQQNASPQHTSPRNAAQHDTGGGSGALDGNAQRIVEDTVTDERAGVNAAVGRVEGARTGTESAARSMQRPAPGAPEQRPAGPAARAAVEPVGAAQPAKPARRGQRPAMPSWEDVLLGTKSTGR